eukprot:TRINITY_DN27795_c4_g1_i1.p1 TRINITY_DN27795_c4_g1~~TRINITY_DN27795_c4_g1_i1.p1  ORF type:complete len:459 (+),score=110.15 TRINITY_DN27795_c4_g1_i1:177-1553(+)
MAAPVAAPRYICFLCKRKFNSSALLTRHKQLSELHRRNLQKQDEENQQRKEELRQVVSRVRYQMQEVDSSLQRQTNVSEEAPQRVELKTQKANLDLKLQQAMNEYGQVQERLEINRHQQLTERAQGAGAPGGQPSWQLNGAHETTIGKLLVSAGAASWQGNKDVQEDRFLTDVELQAPGGQRIIGFIVFDGHSGSLCVDAMIDWLPQNLQKCISTKQVLNEENLKQAVTEACVLTDDEWTQKARERQDLDGTTCCMVLLWTDKGRKQQHRMLIANLGDSRAVLCRSHNDSLSAVRLSDDHKPGRPDERKRIEEIGGVVDMQGVWRVFTPSAANFGGRNILWGLAVSRAFGDLLMKEPQRYGCSSVTGPLVSAMPEIHTYELDPSRDKFIVLACDGIWDVLEDDEAVLVCGQNHEGADQAAQALIRRSFEIGSDDNLTAMVIAWQLDEGESEGKKARLD